MKKGVWIKGIYKVRKCVGAILLTGLLAGTVTLPAVQAVAYTVTPVSALMYTVEGTKIYADADFNSQLLKTVYKDQGVNVTGITSNGWFQVTAGGIYYVPGNELSTTLSTSATGVVTANTTAAANKTGAANTTAATNTTGATNTGVTGATGNTASAMGTTEGNTIGAPGSSADTITTYVPTEISKAIQGTFSFYTKAQLSAFTKDDIEQMTVNEYMKYLDSYLAGKSDPGLVIKKDNKMTIQTEFDKKVALNAVMTATNTTEYLLQYRNTYLNESFWGPVNTLDDVKVSINRAIRYGVNEFSVVCHAYAIGSNTVSMKKQVEALLTEIYDEQGVVFTSMQSYGTFTSDKGVTGSGWLMQLTRSNTASETTIVAPNLGN